MVAGSSRGRNEVLVTSSQAEKLVYETGRMEIRNLLTATRTLW